MAKYNPTQIFKDIAQRYEDDYEIIERAMHEAFIDGVSTKVTLGQWIRNVYGVDYRTSAVVVSYYARKYGF